MRCFINNIPPTERILDLQLVDSTKGQKVTLLLKTFYNSGDNNKQRFLEKHGRKPLEKFMAEFCFAKMRSTINCSHLRIGQSFSLTTL